MIPENKVIEIAYPYTEHKKNIVLSIGIIDSSEIQKVCIGEDGVILKLNNFSYEIGSITKSVVASLISKLVNQDIIHLSDCVWKGITLKQLLTHGSGIDEYPIPDNDFQNPFSDILKNDVKSFVAKAGINPKPDWSYSNLGYALIGMYLEERLNRDFSEVLEDYIRNSLKLYDTHIGYEGADLFGNNGGDTLKWRWNKKSAFLPAGCLVSNMDDMIAYLKLHMTDDSYEICHKTHFETQMPFDMGLAFMKQKEDGIIFCSGLTPGFSSVIGFDSAKRFGVVVLSNYCGYGYGDPDIPMGIGFSILNTLSGNIFDRGNA